MAGMAGRMEQMRPALEAMGKQMEGARAGSMAPADDRDYREPPVAEDLPEDRSE